MTVYNSSIEELYTAAGYTFKNTHYLSIALTHSSYSHEQSRKKQLPCNERLEFLGDSILSLLVSEYLFFKYPDLPEGALTRTRAAVVCESTLHLLAQQIHLGEHLLLGRGEELNNGRERASILSDAFEAFLAAVYIDGGRECAEAFLYRLIVPHIEKHLQPGQNIDYKTLLQQFVQETPGEVLKYSLTGEEGPNHDKVFHVSAYLGNNEIGSGSGKSKRRAEQEAAYAALVLFGVIGQ